MKEEFNQTELWGWARSGSLEPFVLTRGGSPQLKLLRMVDERLDRIYSLPFGEALFTESLSPFGLWGWGAERMAIFGELEELGNVFLNELEASISEAYRDKFDELVEAKIVEMADPEEIDVEEYAFPDLEEIPVPINRVELFLNPDAQKDLILEDLSVNPPPSVEEYAASCLAELKAKGKKPRKEAAKEAAPAPKKEAAPAPKDKAPKDEPPKKETSKAETAKAEQAEEDLLEAISKIRPKNIRLEISGVKGSFTIEKDLAIDDLVKRKGIVTEHLVGDTEGIGKKLVPDTSIVAIYTPKGKDPVFTRSAK